ncbi:hypothetical protein Ciccas_009014 [Cichlidogyrus casuarinus]|uniref:Uncharacterized protein n=1 Tax=Cichlidogyrus casuarinus TaxID=1844966 RepID=A0ABD2PY89_9PLAT
MPQKLDMSHLYFCRNPKLIICGQEFVASSQTEIDSDQDKELQLLDDRIRSEFDQSKAELMKQIVNIEIHYQLDSNNEKELEKISRANTAVENFKSFNEDEENDDIVKKIESLLPDGKIDVGKDEWNAHLRTLITLRPQYSKAFCRVWRGKYRQRRLDRENRRRNKPNELDLVSPNHLAIASFATHNRKTNSRSSSPQSLLTQRSAEGTSLVQLRYAAIPHQTTRVLYPELEPKYSNLVCEMHISSAEESNEPAAEPFVC